MYTIIIPIVLFVIGFLFGWVARRVSSAQSKSSLDSVIGSLKASFGELSLDALSKSTEQLLNLAKERLGAEKEAVTKEMEEKKRLIDQRLQAVSSELDKVSKLMTALEKDREGKYGELATQLKTVSKQTTDLTRTTDMLREALASTKVRGQWGERMAEDVLQICGLIEGVNYLKQEAIKGIGSRPDFTFLLPCNYKLNMDVKFPWENYIKYLGADSDLEKDRFLKNFLRDVKARIKEVTTRDYIGIEQNTVDCVLLFIPNEQIYAFIHEQDISIFDYALENKVIPCSPMTLFGVLAVIRQAVDNFNVAQASSEILLHLSAFEREWGKFRGELELLGKRIMEVQKEYNTLTTTRLRQLEKPLNGIEDLRTQRKLPIFSDKNDKETFSAIEEAEREDREDLFWKR